MDPKDRPIVFTPAMVRDFRRLVVHLTMFDMGARIGGRVDIQLAVWRELVLAPALRLLADMTPDPAEIGPGDDQTD